ncbi:hypothetical protein ACFL6T_02860 [Candidatus Zixiibacteriota bacterium]
MKRSTILTERNRSRWATIFAVIILLPIGISAFGLDVSRDPEMPDIFLEPVDPQWENCIRDSTEMRFHHMDILKEIRDNVIRRGIRDEVTLAGCGTCHLNREQFCDRCHAAASVTLDCFRCHYYPESSSERVSMQGGR